MCVGTSCYVDALADYHFFVAIFIQHLLQDLSGMRKAFGTVVRLDVSRALQEPCACEFTHYCCVIKKNGMAYKD
jgi:hypothetical protein